MLELSQNKWVEKKWKWFCILYNTDKKSYIQNQKDASL